MRKIRQEFVDWLDSRLANDRLAQAAIENKWPTALLVRAAIACIGIREEGGNNKGPFVKLIQSTIGAAENEPWCMSLVQTLVAYAELKTGIKSPLYPSESCAEVFEYHPKNLIRMVPAMGLIAVWGKYGLLNKYKGGHTGIVRTDSEDPRYFKAVEGNTDPGDHTGPVEREGGGVYGTSREVIRELTKDDRMIVRGFLIPF